MTEFDVAESDATVDAKKTKSTKKPAAKSKTPVAKTTTRPRKKTPAIKISQEQRLGMIAEAAYFKAEKRGFSGGDPVADWLAAESEVDALLSSNPVQSTPA